MRWSFMAALTAGSMLLMQGCSSALMEKNNLAGEPEGFFVPVEQEADPVAPMVLRVIGYGAMASDKGKTEVQQRLMAIRAARLDAYRAMAERVYGAALQGSTTVRDMVVQNDHFRSYVETYLHGARVVSTDVMADGSVETVLEMVIDQGFRNCLQTMDNQRFNVDCRAPLSGRELNHFASGQRQRVPGNAELPDAGFYFIE